MPQNSRPCLAGGPGAFSSANRLRSWVLVALVLAAGSRGASAQEADRPGAPAPPAAPAPAEPDREAEPEGD
ncbi:MAG: hypothetical protein ACODAG_08475, partial [Myxococcota bacterium]